MEQLKIYERMDERKSPSKMSKREMNSVILRWFDTNLIPMPEWMIKFNKWKSEAPPVTVVSSLFAINAHSCSNRSLFD